MSSQLCLISSEPVPWGWTIANKVVLKKVREALGFQQCKVFAVGAAPIKMETMEYFMSVNIPIMNVYGKDKLFMFVWPVYLYFLLSNSFMYYLV